MEQVVVIAIGIVALASVLIRFVRLARGEQGGSCPGCGNCGRKRDRIR